MKPSVILRRQDPRIKHLIDLRDDKHSALLLLEGPRLLREALQSSLALDVLVICQSRCEKAAAEEIQLVEAARARAKETLFVNDPVFHALSDVEEPQGIAAFCVRPQWTWNDLLSKAPRPIVVLDGIQNPGNVAAICRTAEAAGAAGVITTAGTSHLFSPKAVRGAMGSTFRLPSLEHLPYSDIAQQLSAAGYKLAGAEASPIAIPYTQLDWKEPWAIVLGQEGAGLHREWQPLLQQRIKIPMASPVESLNVGASAAVLLYESSRQRN